MALQGNLFIKVFVAFWLVTIAILGSWLLATDYFEVQPPLPEQRNSTFPRQQHRFMLRMIYTLEHERDEIIVQAADNVREKYGIQIYLVNRDGVDLLGRKVPRRVASIAKTSLAGDDKPFFTSPREHLAAHLARHSEEGTVSAVFIFPRNRGLILNTLSDSLWLRIGLAVVISGLICFGLSKLMTNRLRDLQLASRRLANGDLDTRLKVRSRGGDETDELARDFNTMAEQLQERIQAQKRLLGDVSHELRSPLARLRVSLALAQDRPENRDAYMQRIERETLRLEELINQLLSSQSREICLTTQVDLVPLLEQLCADANFEGQREGKQFIFNSAIRQAFVDSSADLLHKSFENILRNALHHTGESSRVHVSLTPIDGSYLITIEDQGPGVPEQDLDKIFDEFYRVDTARTPQTGGFGLGLAIARRAILEHGGSISARNTGTGLNISILLPAHH